MIVPTPIRRALLAICLLATAATGAAGQDAAPDERLVARLSPEARLRIEPLVERARVRGLPVEPLVQKALEGESRGADAERIAEAVRELADRLDSARSSLGPRSSEAELVAGASVLYVGVTMDQLRELRRSAGARPLAAPLTVLADLAGRGVTAPTAFAAVRAVVLADASGPALDAFRQAVVRDIAQGVTPDAAASIRARGVAPPPGAVRERGRLPVRFPRAPGGPPRGAAGPAGPGGPGGR